MQERLTVIGIDPGTSHLGVARVAFGGPKPEVIGAWTLLYKEKECIQDRLSHIWRDLCALGCSNSHLIGIEEQAGALAGHSRMGDTNHSASLVLEVVGLLEGYALGTGLALLRVSPQEVNKVCGISKPKCAKGMTPGERAKVKAAGKALAKERVYELADGVPKRISTHAADAILVAIAAWNRYRKGSE